MLDKRIAFVQRAHGRATAEPRPSSEFEIPDDIGNDQIQNNRLMFGCRGLK